VKIRKEVPAFPAGKAIPDDSARFTPASKDDQDGYVLIARKNGSSSSRRQRRFASFDDVQRAVSRWREESYNVSSFARRPDQRACS
jgi:hypothetical protein